jgi:hypothetical protein
MTVSAAISDAMMHHYSEKVITGFQSDCDLILHKKNDSIVQGSVKNIPIPSLNNSYNTELIVRNSARAVLGRKLVCTGYPPVCT